MQEARLQGEDDHYLLSVSPRYLFHDRTCCWRIDEADPKEDLLNTPAQ